MDWQFFDSSTEIQNVKVGREIGKAKYPWKELPTGKSFIIKDKSSIKLAVLRSLASKSGKALGKKFRVYEHESCYEVACLSMSEEEAAQTSSNVVEALKKIDKEKEED